MIITLRIPEYNARNSEQNITQKICKHYCLKQYKLLNYVASYIVQCLHVTIWQCLANIVQTHKTGPCITALQLSSLKSRSAYIYMCNSLLSKEILQCARQIIQNENCKSNTMQSTFSQLQTIIFRSSDTKPQARCISTCQVIWL